MEENTISSYLISEIRNRKFTDQNCKEFQKILSLKIITLRVFKDQNLLEQQIEREGTQRETLSLALDIFDWELYVTSVVQHKMQLSSCQTFFFIDVELPLKASFKFIVDGKYETSSYYPTLKEKLNRDREEEISKILGSNSLNLKFEFRGDVRSLEELSDLTLTYSSYITGSVKPKTCANQSTNTKALSQKFQDTQEGNKEFRQQIEGQNQLITTKQTQKHVHCNSDISFQMSSHHSKQSSIYDYIQEDDYHFVGDAFNIPKHQKQPTEDAYFITEKGVGISDGVGGWHNYGIDCSLFSKTLMKECQKFIQRVQHRQKQFLMDPRVTLQELECHRQALETSLESMHSMISSDSSNFSFAASQISAERDHSQASFIAQAAKNLCPQNILKFCLRRTHFPGSATVTMCVLNNQDMTCLNLGDSGFILFRFDSTNHDPYILIKSNEKLHGFNTPYQLTILPSKKEVEILKSQQKKKELANLQKAMKEKKFCEDQPEDSDIYQVRVREGDLLLLATDGVFDNLFLDEIMAIVRNNTYSKDKSKQIAHNIAKALCEQAFQKSKKTFVKTPFQMKKTQYIIHQKNRVKQGLMGDQESKEMKRLIKENGIDEDILVDNEYEESCYGKGKPDDITAAAYWITSRKQSLFRRRKTEFA